MRLVLELGMQINPVAWWFEYELFWPLELEETKRSEERKKRGRGPGRVNARRAEDYVQWVANVNGE